MTVVYQYTTLLLPYFGYLDHLQGDGQQRKVEANYFTDV
jgi:hypothetical protein